MSLKDKAAQGVKWTTFSTVFNALITFVQMIILARLLDPVDFGLMGMVLIVVGFGQIFSDMGLSSAIIYRQDTTRQQLSSLYWLNIISGVVACAVVLICTPIISSFYNESRLDKLIYLASLIFLITPLGHQYQILLQKDLQFNLLAGITILGSLINAIVAVLLAWQGFGVFSLVWGQLASSCARVMALIIMNHKRWSPSFHFDHKDLRGYLSFGIYQMGDRTANYFNVYLIQILLGAMLGAKALGYYTLAFDTVIKPTMAIAPVLTRVAFPVFSRLQGNMLQMKKGYLKILQLLSLFNFPVTFGVAVVAPLAVPVIYGEKWIPSVVLIQILALAAVLRSMASPQGSLLLSKGKADWGFYWSLGSMIVQLPFLYLGVKLGMQVGAALAFCIVQFIFVIISYFILLRRILGPFMREYMCSVWPAFWMSSVMVLCVYVINLAVPHMRNLYFLLFQIFCGIGIYVILVYVSQKTLMFELIGLLWKKK